MEKIRIGIIGAGNMGRNHIRLTSEMTGDFELVGIYDPDPERIKIASNYGIIYFNSIDELMQKVDAVVIAVPSSLHFEVAQKAAGYGLHALIEKPLALEVSHAKEINDAFSKIGKTLMVGHVERFNPVVVEMEKILKDEEIIAINIQRCSPMVKRIGDADVIWDLMIHDIDILINALNQSAIQNVYAQGRTAYSKNLVDYAQAQISFQNGVISSIIASRTTEDKIRSINVHAKNCFVRADLLNRALVITRCTSYKLDTGYEPTYRQENVMERVFIPNVEPLKMELFHFADCIRTGKVPKTNGDNALLSLKTLSQISDKIYF